MGLSLFKNCSTNYTPEAPAPNPNPGRYEILSVWYHFNNAHVLKVRYPDCTNFEGIKIMVYLGPYFIRTGKLDPHFSDDKHSPIARFPPTQLGLDLALELAVRL